MTVPPIYRSPPNFGLFQPGRQFPCRGIMPLTAITPAELRAALGLPINAWVDGGVEPGTDTDQTDALQRTIDLTPEFGACYLPANTYPYRYNISDELVIDKRMSFLGECAYADYGSTGRGTNAINIPLVSPYLAGSVINQTTADKNVFTVTAVGGPVNFFDLALTFDDPILFLSTGDGIRHQASNYSGRPDQGQFGGTVARVMVFGTDGDHYGFYYVNTLYSRMETCHSFGGGLLCLEANSAAPTPNFGNFVAENLYAQLIQQGSAKGLHLKNTNGFNNLILFNRLQTTVEGMILDFPQTTKPLSTQNMFYADDDVLNLTVIQGDWEYGNIADAPNGPDIKLPLRAYNIDPASLVNGQPIGGPTQQGGRWSYLQPSSYQNRSVRIDLSVQNNVQTPGDNPMGFYDAVTGRFGPAVQVDGTGGILSVARVNPRPPADECDSAQAALDTEVHTSIQQPDGSFLWDDVAAAPTITAFGDVGTLRFEVTVNGQGTNGNPIATLVNAAGGGDFTAASGQQPIYDDNVRTPSGMITAHFDGVDDFFSSSVSAGDDTFTDFYILRPADLNTNKRVISGSDSGSAGIETYISNSGSPLGRFGANRTGTTTLVESTYPVLNDIIQLITIRYDGTTGITRCNSTLMGENTVTTTLGAANVRLGKGGSLGGTLKGWIAGWYRYIGSLSDTDMLSVEKLIYSIFF